MRGQPYLTQLIGHSLVRLYNRAVFEDNRPREARFRPEDVDAVVEWPVFYQQGNYYFNGLWQQAGRIEASGQQTLLRCLAAADGPLSPEALLAEAKLETHAGQTGLEALIRLDVLHYTQGEVDFTVPLMRRWVRQFSN